MIHGDLERIFQKKRRLEPKMISKFLESDKEHLTMFLSGANKYYAIGALVLDNDIKEAKQYFYNVALLDSYKVKKLQSRMFNSQLSAPGYAMLSDNWEFLEQEYSKLSYDSFYLDDDTEEKIKYTMDDAVEDADGGAVWVRMMQLLMIGDRESVKPLIEKARKNGFNTKGDETMRGDLKFFEGMVAQDKKICEEGLSMMLEPKTNKYRNQNNSFNEYISMPALGYAKLAWKNGIEVEIDNPLLPRDLLPIEPLDKYEIPYEFLLEDAV